MLVADDEPLARARLRALLARHPEFELSAECGSGTAVLAALRDGPADVLLLDIRMPGLDGMATVEALAQQAPWSLDRPPCIVFVTASEEHAIRAFDLDAVDYLVKPVDIDRFDRAMRRLLEKLGAPSRVPDAGAIAAADTALRAALQALRGDASAPAGDSGSRTASLAGSEAASEAGYAKRFVIRDASGMYFVPVVDVDRVEADGNYVAVVAGGRRHLLRESLHLLASRLNPEEFVRVHRSHLVRINRIRRLEPCGHGEYELTMTDGTRLTSSRSYGEQVRRLLR
ncbi:response regulator transcription factor [Gemmatimonas groenlandica]|uniref:Response regulator transcription factor n=1 Tax=Gemmatimonas groenlandica TaxID=2732249 RepID=A0A6M4IT14_9BACT|nr:LytTR family DNA-binding domain-containing protein [Gemmatimonas groenlandica]QJR37873.1 response regulator transcription factor [Gemmatimonas groenlandica]